MRLRLKAVVNGGKLRCTAGGEHGIIISNYRQIFRYAKSLTSGVFHGAYGKRIFRCDHAVKTQLLFGKTFQIIGDVVHLLRVSLVEENPFLIIRDGVCLHGCAKTAQLFDAAVGIGIVQIEDVLNPRVKHGTGCLEHGCVVIAERAVHIRIVKGSVEQHNGNLCGNVLDVLVLLLIGTDEVGANENNTVHFLGKNEV